MSFKCLIVDFIYKHLSIYLSIYLSTYLSIYLYVKPENLENPQTSSSRCRCSKHKFPTVNRCKENKKESRLISVFITTFSHCKKTEAVKRPRWSFLRKQARKAPSYVFDRDLNKSLAKFLRNFLTTLNLKSETSVDVPNLSHSRCGNFLSFIHKLHLFLFKVIYLQQSFIVLNF